MDPILLKAVRNWADERLASGQEPPWSWYQLMKLREALDALTGEAAPDAGPASATMERSRPAG